MLTEVSWVTARASQEFLNYKFIGNAHLSKPKCFAETCFSENSQGVQDMEGIGERETSQLTKPNTALNGHVGNPSSNSCSEPGKAGV